MPPVAFDALSRTAWAQRLEQVQRPSEAVGALPCHYESPRVLTTRECARLQTFPDWFRFHPVKWHGNRQVGNAVPVLLAESVGKALFAQLGLHFGNGSAPTIDRNDALIADDITKAEAARLDEKRITHQVVGTRKPGNSPRVERRSRMGQQ